MSELVACASCRRHVRRGDARCPFCAASKALAIAAIGVSLAAPACKSETKESTKPEIDAAVAPPSPPREERKAAVYGGPPPRSDPQRLQQQQDELLKALNLALDGGFDDDASTKDAGKAPKK